MEPPNPLLLMSDGYAYGCDEEGNFFLLEGSTRHPLAPKEFFYEHLVDGLAIGLTLTVQDHGGEEEEDATVDRVHRGNHT